ncbi:MAG: cell division protein ZapA [Pseudomonadota bacterium]
MAQLSLTINKRGYEITCDDGQENRLRQLGSYIDEKVGELVNSVGQVGEARLLVMASLLICDELLEAKLKLAGKQDQANGSAKPVAAADAQAEDEAAKLLEACALRIQTIAERMQVS